MDIPGYFIVPYEKTKQQFSEVDPTFQFEHGNDRLGLPTKSFLTPNNDIFKEMYPQGPVHPKNEPISHDAYDDFVYVEKYYFSFDDGQNLNRYKRRFRKSRHPKKDLEFPTSWDQPMDISIIQNFDALMNSASLSPEKMDRTLPPTL